MSSGSATDYYKFDDETILSYEIGTKNTLLNNRLILNASIFYMKLSDMQVQQPVTSSASYLANAAEATGKGFEFDLNYQVTNSLSTNFGFGYSDVTFDSYTEDILDSSGNKTGENDYSGNQNYYAPKYNYNIGVNYRANNGFYGNVNLVGYGKTYLDRANEYKRDPYSIVNAKIGYETEQVDVYLYAKNLFDKTYNSEGYFGGNYTLTSAPRQVGVQVKYRFR